MLGVVFSSRTPDMLSQPFDRPERIDSRFGAVTLYGPEAGGCNVLEEER
jgi:hypothetical protein